MTKADIDEEVYEKTVISEQEAARPTELLFFAVMMES